MLYRLTEEGSGPTTVAAYPTGDQRLMSHELSVGPFRLSLPNLDLQYIATLGFGFFEKAILDGKSKRYRARTPELQDEIKGALLPGSGRRKCKDPVTKLLNALTQTLVEATQTAQSEGIAIPHVTRRLTTPTYN